MLAKGKITMLTSKAIFLWISYQKKNMGFLHIILWKKMFCAKKVTKLPDLTVIRRQVNLYWVCTWEYWMIYWGPGFSPPAPSPSPFLSLTVFLCVADPAFWREGGGGEGGAKSHDRNKAGSSIHHLILYGFYGYKYVLYCTESKIILSFSGINRVFTEFDGIWDHGHWYEGTLPSGHQAIKII
jgi:hypothetical protein